MAATSSALTKLDYIDLVHGEFVRTSPNDLAQAFAAYGASQTNHLAVFFHGGLVSRNEGMAEAELLIDGYRNVGAYPFFFIWNSGLLTALQRQLFPFAQNLVIRRVVERHIQFFSRLLLAFLEFEDPGRALLSAIANLRRNPVPPPLTTLAALGRVVDSIWAGKPPGVTLPPPDERNREIQAFEEDVAKDVLDFGGFLAEAIRFTPAVGGGIIRRVWQRLRSRHDHGLYTTLIEEIARAIRLDDLLASLWESMKRDIDDAFRGDGTVYGGTAFLERLATMTWNTNTRLTLIAHSGGAVYIDRMLNAIDATLPREIKTEIVFIAAAVSFDVFAATIHSNVFKRRVCAYRFFALDDECEGGYWEVPGVYDKSVLYLLSALCERDREADKALVGMQRYWSGSDPYDPQMVPSIGAVTTAIDLHERVWSPTDKTALPGFRANAREHSRFAEEMETNESVEVFLS